jgi:hypothetical protein
VIYNVENDDNEARTEQFKALVDDCDGFDDKVRRILSVCREGWWGVPYDETEQQFRDFVRDAKRRTGT